jgi:MoaA/NifB/PqqE/SkfB family radical SAM enzyme
VNLNIDITSGCNLRCPSCPTGSLPKRFSFMEPKLFDAIVNKISRECPGASVGLFDVCEPTLNSNWLDYVELGVSIGLVMWISTNLNVPIDCERLGKSGIDSAIISLSGYTQAVYESGHAGGKIERVHRQMRELAKHKHDIKFRVAYHCYRDNLGDGEYGATKLLCRELGFRFYPMIARLNQVKNALNWQRTDAKTLDRLIVHPSLYAKLNAGREQEPCVMLEENLSINCHGQVQLCCNVPDSNHAGYFLDMPLAEIQRKRKEPNEVCRACMASNIHKLFEYSGTANWIAYANTKLPRTMLARMFWDELKWKARRTVGSKTVERIKKWGYK